MCITAIMEEIEKDDIKMTKSIKISENAHKALEYAKVMDGILIGEYASMAIMEAIRVEHPNAYSALKKHLTTEQTEKT